MSLASFLGIAETSIGNHMISSAIWNKEALVNFSNSIKVHKPIGRVHFVLFEKFTSAYLVAREKSWDYLLIQSRQTANYSSC